MQTTVAKGVAMSKFCSDPNKNAIFFIFVKVLTEKIFEYDKGQNKDHIFSIFQIWQNLQFYKKILCKTTLTRNCIDELTAGLVCFQGSKYPNSTFCTPVGPWCFNYRTISRLIQNLGWASSKTKKHTSRNSQVSTITCKRVNSLNFERNFVKSEKF